MNAAKSSPPCDAPVRPGAAQGPEPELVRRLDWRFLLPQPRLGRVAYIGAAQGRLVPALAVLSESLWLPATGPAARVDVLVAEGVGRRALEAVLPTVADGGALYWELPRHRNPFRSDVGWLRARGYRDIALHWHCPGFEECRQIVALDDPLGAVFLVRDHIGRFGRHVSSRTCRWMTATRGLWRVLPAVSITALKRPQAPTS